MFNFVAANFGPQTKPSNEAKLWILMYHRILPLEKAKELNEEAGMFVTPETFNNHMSWLKEIMQPITLSDWVEHTQQNSLRAGNYFAITFDDGWQDNYEYGFPILKQHQLPATIFLVSSMMGTEKLFWPNRLASLVEKIADFNISTESLNALRNKLDITASTDFSDISNIIASAKQLSDAELNTLMDNIEKELDLNQSPRQLLDWNEIQEMLDSKLIDLGAHTKHHIRLLESVPNAIIDDEVLGSKLEIEKKTDQSIQLFCYPNGDYSHYSANQVQNNFLAAVTTQKGINNTQEQLHKLKRVGVHQDISASKSAFFARMSCWI